MYVGLFNAFPYSLSVPISVNIIFSQNVGS